MQRAMIRKWAATAAGQADWQEGWLEELPHPAWPLVLRLLGPGTRHLVTSAVQEIVRSSAGTVVFRTMHSTYELRLAEEGA